MILINVINEICKEKAAKGIIPAVATYSEIVTRTPYFQEEIKKELNSLVLDGVLIWHRTLNGYSFQVKDK